MLSLKSRVRKPYIYIHILVLTNSTYSCADETTVLGTGFFGIVMKGSVVRENGESTTVAVKAVKRNVGVLYFKALLSELKIMSFIGKHSNIVSLIGACTHNIRKSK